MKLRFPSALATTLLVASVALVGCSSGSSQAETDESATSDSAGASANGASSDEPCVGTYEYLTQLASIDFFTDAKNGLEAAERDFGVETRFSGPTTVDLPALLQAIDQAIARKPDGIMILGWDAALIPSINKATEEGIMVAVNTADLPESDRLFFVGANNTAWGVEMGKALKEAIGDTGEILVVRDPSLGNVAERLDGLKAAIADTPGITIVADVNDRSDTEQAAQAVSSALLANPNVTAVVALDGVAGPAVATAVREAGLNDKVKVIAVNRDAAVLKAIEEGSITVAFAEHPQVEAYTAIQLMQNAKCGSLQISNDDESAGVAALPFSVDTGVSKITKDNVEFFARD